MLHLIVLAHAGQDAADFGVGGVGSSMELLEFLIVGILDILRIGKHGADHGRQGDDRLQAFLDCRALDQAALGAVFAHVGEIAEQEGVADRRGDKSDDAFALLLLKAQHQIRSLHHRTGEPSGAKTAGIDADAVHDAPGRRVDLVRRQAFRTGTRHPYAGAAQVPRQQ